TREDRAIQLWIDDRVAVGGIERNGEDTPPPIGGPFLEMLPFDLGVRRIDRRRREHATLLQRFNHGATCADHSFLLPVNGELGTSFPSSAGADTRAAEETDSFHK